MIPRAASYTRTLVRHSIKSIASAGTHRFSFPIEQRRTLYTNESLSLDKVAVNIEKVEKQFGQHKALFTGRFEELLNDSESTIQSEDFKNLILLTKDKKDVELLKRSIEKFARQTNETFKPFVFGPFVMRVATLINEPSIALMLMDKNNIDFFNQATSIVLAMNLLYRNGKYQEICDLYRFVCENYKYSRAAFIEMFYAASYRLNTPEAFDECIQAYRKLKKDSTRLSFHSLLFFMALGLKQNRPKTVLEFTDIFSTRYFSRSILQFKFMAFADVGNFDSIINISNSILNKPPRDETDPAKSPKQQNLFTTDTLEYLGKRFNDSASDEQKESFEAIKSKALAKNIIDNERTIEKILNEQIKFYRIGWKTPEQAVNQNEFRRMEQ